MSINKIIRSLLSSLVLFILCLFFVNSAHAQSPRVYVTNHQDNTVSVIDSGTNTVIATVPVGGCPAYMALSPDNSKLYVSNHCYPDTTGSISIINTNTDAVMATIQTNFAPGGFFPSPDGTRLYVAEIMLDQNYQVIGGAVGVYDTSNNTLLTSIPVPNGPIYFAGNAAGTKIYVSSTFGGDAVSVIDTTTNTVTATIPVDGSPTDLVLSPSETSLYVVHLDNVSTIDLTTNTITQSVPTTGHGDMIGNSTGTRLYVPNPDNIQVIDPGQNVEVATVPVVPAGGLDILPDDSRIYVASGNTVAIVDTASNTVVGNIIAGSNPFGVIIEKNVSPTPTPTPIQLTALSPAKVWIGLKNSDDVGVKFDLKVEAYKDTTLVSSGELDSVPAGSSGFNNAKLDSIPFNSFSPVDFPSGSQLKLELYVRNACSGSGHNSGTARLWYNDSAANSQFGTTIGSNSSTYYLLDNFFLGTSTGLVKKTIDIQSGAKCSAFKPFGTWSVTP